MERDFFYLNICIRLPIITKSDTSLDEYAHLCPFNTDVPNWFCDYCYLHNQPGASVLLASAQPMDLRY